MKGLPASGKSTRAKEIVDGGGNFVRLNRDLLRKMLHFDRWTGKNEGVTIKTQELMAEQLLNSGKNVIIDDTNMSEDHDARWAYVAESLGARFEIEHIDTPMNDCILRDHDRWDSVGEAVIKNMAMQYNMFPDLENIVVVDIDGTVADCSHRQHHVRGDKKDWKAFFAGMSDDTPRRDVWSDAYGLAEENNARIIFVSARPEDYREVTEEWLGWMQMHHAHLLMRRSGDKRPDTEVKSDIYDKYLSHYNIIKVFDDRPSVIQMWRDKGLDVEDVGEGIDF